MPGHFLSGQYRAEDAKATRTEEAGKLAVGTSPRAFLQCLSEPILFPNQSPEADARGGDWLVALAD